MIFAWLLLLQPGIFAQGNTDSFKYIDSLINVNDLHQVGSFIRNNKSGNWERQLAAAYAGIRIVALNPSNDLFLQPERELFQMINNSLLNCSQLDRYIGLNFNYRIIERYLSFIYQQLIHTGNQYLSSNNRTDISGLLPDLQFAAGRFIWAKEHGFFTDQSKLAHLWLMHFNLAYLIQNESEMLIASKNYESILEKRSPDSALELSPLIWLCKFYKADPNYQDQYLEINNRLIDLSIDNESYIRDRIYWIFKTKADRVKSDELTGFMERLSETAQLKRLSIWTLSRCGAWVSDSAVNFSFNDRLTIADQLGELLIERNWITADSFRLWIAVLVWNQTNLILKKRSALHDLHYGKCSNEWIRYYLNFTQRQLQQLNKRKISEASQNLVQEFTRRLNKVLQQIPELKKPKPAGTLNLPTCTEPILYLHNLAH